MSVLVHVEWPILSMFWFLLSASNMATPPFLNLVGELYLSFGLLGLDMMFSFPLGLMFFYWGVLTLCTFLLLLSMVVYGKLMAIMVF